MAEERPVRVEASVTLEGPAEELLAALLALRGGGTKSVLLTLGPIGRASLPYYTLPAIRGGQLQDALDKLAGLAEQTIVDAGTERRVAGLVRDFARWTR